MAPLHLTFGWQSQVATEVEHAKGLDLTIGGPIVIQTSNAPMTIRGGALLRTVRRRIDNQVIYGPSLLVDQLLRLSAHSIDHRANTAWSGNISALYPPTQTRDPSMYLQRTTRVSSPGKCPTVHRSPRVDLYLFNPDMTDSITNARVVFI